MIYLQLTGGLGNQMFQYAFAKALQYQTGEKIGINTYGFRFDNQRDYALSAFALSPDVLVLDEKTGKKQWKWTQIFIRLLFVLNKINGAGNFYKLTKRGLYFTYDIYNFYQYMIPEKKNKYVFGTFQSEKYFAHIRERILEDFRMKVPMRKELGDWVKQVSQCESVCVHIRRGDYVADAKNNQILNICSEQYYIRAVERIKQKINTPPVFYVFSNSPEDLDWIKENWNLGDENIIYVDINNRDYEELLLMSACKHFIIANSTFSWWAQFLGNYQGKTVIAPNRWFEGQQNAADIYSEQWELIEVE